MQLTFYCSLKDGLRCTLFSVLNIRKETLIEKALGPITSTVFKNIKWPLWLNDFISLQGFCFCFCLAADPARLSHFIIFNRRSVSKLSWVSISVPLNRTSVFSPSIQFYCLNDSIIQSLQQGGKSAQENFQELGLYMGTVQNCGLFFTYLFLHLIQTVVTGKVPETLSLNIALGLLKYLKFCLACDIYFLFPSLH